MTIHVFKPARHTKLEKADILEMTVRHLQSLHRTGGRPPAPTAIEPSSSSATAAALTAAVVQKFQTGYQECAGEVNRFVGRLDGVDDDIKKRLMSHLDSCVAKMRYVAAVAGTGTPLAPLHAHRGSYSLQQQQQPLDTTALATVVAAVTPGGRPQFSHVGGPSVPPLPPAGHRHRISAFTAVHGPFAPDTDRSPYVYCDEPAVSSTSSWAEDVAAAAAATVKNPPLDFSMKKEETAPHGNKRPLGDIPVNVPTAATNAAAATASSSHHHKSTMVSGDDGGPTPTAQRPVVVIAAAGRPCDGGPGSDPNMWRPW